MENGEKIPKQHFVCFHKAISDSNMSYTFIKQHTIFKHYVMYFYRTIYHSHPPCTLIKNKTTQTSTHHVEQFNIVTSNAYLPQQKHICTQYTLLQSKTTQFNLIYMCTYLKQNNIASSYLKRYNITTSFAIIDNNKNRFFIYIYQDENRI